MNIKSIKFFVIFSSLLLILNACAKNEFFNKDFKHNTPLIKEDVKKSGKSEVDKTVKMGPKPNEGDHKKGVCVILGSESGECMRLEAGGMASMEVVEEVVPVQNDYQYLHELVY